MLTDAQRTILERLYHARAWLDLHHAGAPEAIQAALREIDGHRLDARKFYAADGTFEILDSPHEVIRRRIEAAGRLEGGPACS